jgi:cobalt-zinc-cadmium efflux system outer membrane protein
MASASREGILLRDRMLARAQEAYGAVEEGYRLGKFRYVDVIEASGSLVEARKRHLEAVTAHNLARVELEGLLAPPPAVDESSPARMTKEEGR